MFKHYLITRFNLRVDVWNVTKNNEKLLTDEWMDNRMWLFENFCFPTILSQTNQNFDWLLYFDSNTKEIYKNKIINLVSNHNNIKVLFVDAMPSFMPELLKNIAQETKDIPYLITTRIDNDDSIHIDFINEVQKQFNQQEYRAIDFINGYSLQIEPKYLLGKKDQLFNPFISLIEKNENSKTVFYQDHRLWKRDKNVTQISKKRLWLSIIHQRNKINRFDGYGNVNWGKLKNDFILSDDANDLISIKTIPFSKWIFTNLKNLTVHKFELNYKLFKKKIGFYKFK